MSAVTEIIARLLVISEEAEHILAALDGAEPDKTAASDETAVPGEAFSGGAAPDDAAPDGAPPNGAAPGEAALNGAALNGGGR